MPPTELDSFHGFCSPSDRGCTHACRRSIYGRCIVSYWKETPFGWLPERGLGAPSGSAPSPVLASRRPRWEGSRSFWKHPKAVRLPVETSHSQIFNSTHRNDHLPNPQHHNKDRLTQILQPRRRSIHSNQALFPGRSQGKVKHSLGPSSLLTLLQARKQSLHGNRLPSQTTPS